LEKIQSIEKRIDALMKWERKDLAAEWEKLFGRDAPCRISQNLMVCVIAHKWQEQAFGGLSASDQKLLDRMANAFKQNPTFLKPSLQIKNGTRLRRLWRGKYHEVTAASDGFVYEGNKYRSLSEVARTITGTRWNGLVFFGLKKGQHANDHATA
jgi:hypothetical protein